MKIRYLGTAAAEGVPALFCECDNCQKARALGGKNIRTRSQSLIDDCLLIDFPADTYLHFLQYNLPMHKIHNCLITHSHLDHLYEKDISIRKNGFSHLSDKTPLTFYSDVSGYELIDKEIKRCNNLDAKVEKLQLNTPFNVEGYTVTALRAAHDQKSSPVIFIIEKDGKSIFYSNDTSEYPEESFNYLKTLKKPFDLLSLDCTEACGPCDYVGHMNLDRCIALVNQLKGLGIVNDNTRIVLNHFSHNGANVSYEEFSEIAKKYGMITAYDGLEIEI